MREAPLTIPLIRPHLNRGAARVELVQIAADLQESIVATTHSAMIEPPEFETLLEHASIRAGHHCFVLDLEFIKPFPGWGAAAWMGWIILVQVRIMERDAIVRIARLPDEIARVARYLQLTAGDMFLHPLDLEAAVARCFKTCAEDRPS